MEKQIQEKENEDELNIFAQFFGNLLMELKKHDLRLPLRY